MTANGLYKYTQLHFSLVFEFTSKNNIVSHNNGNKRRGGRERAWTTEQVVYLFLFSDMWKLPGYDDSP